MTEVCERCGAAIGPGTEVCARCALTPEAAPTVIDGAFELGKTLGDDGLGPVFAGRDVARDEAVAIRVIRPRTEDRAQVMGRFLPFCRQVGQETLTLRRLLVDWTRRSDSVDSDTRFRSSTTPATWAPISIPRPSVKRTSIPCACARMPAGATRSV